MTIEDIWYGRGTAPAVARAALTPLSLLYAGAVSMRGAAYDLGLHTVSTAPAPVVSVGGLRVGGAGKTPFVLWLARQLTDRGLSPCIVTRGYGGTGDPGRPRLLRQAAGDLSAAEVAEVGDEAALLLLRSGCPVVLGGDRGAACALAFRELSADGAAPSVFLLDDGFQHRRLARALDVVLVDGREFGESLLPAGPLREGPAALARADVVVAMGKGAPVPVLHPGQVLVRGCVRASALVASAGVASGEDPASLSGRRVVALAAIARPERFLAELEGLGALVVARILRRDHHRYDASDLREIASHCAQADLVVTTEKDLVKLEGAGIFGGGLRALRIEVCVDEGQALVDRVAALVRDQAAI